LALYREHGAVSGIPLTVGQVLSWRGDYDGAERLLREMLDSAGTASLRGAAAAHLGQSYLHRGRFAEALELLRTAAAGGQSFSPLMDGWATMWLGCACCALGRMAEALHHVRSALHRLEEHGEIVAVCEARIAYGTVLHAIGDVAGAVEQHRLALDAADGLGVPLLQAQAADGLAECHADADADLAAALRARADAIYQRLGVVRPASIRPGRLSRA
jgi:tetratricopeptide (TPR) repeat protein